MSLIHYEACLVEMTLMNWATVGERLWACKLQDSRSQTAFYVEANVLNMTHRRECFTYLFHISRPSRKRPRNTVWEREADLEKLEKRQFDKLSV